jgi:uncharacterized protein (DUF4415 family)
LDYALSSAGTALLTDAVRNPYAKRLKRQLTIRLDEETIDYFQGLSREVSLPYQTLMNMYLRDCAETRKRPHWSVSSTTGENLPTRGHNL